MRKNEMYMSFLADSVNESLARITVAAFAMELNLRGWKIEDIRTSVSEAVTKRNYPWLRRKRRNGRDSLCTFRPVITY